MIVPVEVVVTLVEVVVGKKVSDVVDALVVVANEIAHVVRHDNLGDVEALRAKVTEALTRKSAVQPTRKVARLRRAVEPWLLWRSMLSV